MRTVLSSALGKAMREELVARNVARLVALPGWERQPIRPRAVRSQRPATATLLKNLGVPARDAQLILGHSRISVTLEIYALEDAGIHREALGRISEALAHADEDAQDHDDEGEDDEADGE